MQKQMKQMTAAQRWDAINLGMQQGKSNREIARQLGCDEATIRRERKKMELPDNWTEEIKQGSPAELYLRATREQEAAQKRLQRKQEEQASGVHSRRIALTVVRFLWNDIDLDCPNIIAVLDDVAKYFYYECPFDFRESPSINAKRVLTELRIELQSKFQSENQTDDLPRHIPDRMNLCIAILKKAIPRIAPERIVRTRCFPQMVTIVEEADRRPKRLSPPWKPSPPTFPVNKRGRKARA